MKRLRLVGAGVALIAAGVAAMIGLNHKAHPNAPAHVAAVSIPDGVYTIGKDIGSGRWHTDGARTQNLWENGQVVQVLTECHWRIGWPESQNREQKTVVVAEGNGTQPFDISMAPVGAVFVTKGCKPWRRVA